MGACRYILRLKWLIGLALLLLLATKHQPGSWNDRSRLATVESLVERGSLSIDQSKVFETGDKILVNGRLYSDKLPMLSLWGAVIYWLLYNVVGISFSGQMWLCYWVVTLCTVGLCSLFCAYLMYHLSRDAFMMGHSWSVFMALSFVISTILLSYSVTFNAHVPAAACITGVIYLLFSMRESERISDGSLLLMGLLLGFGGSFEAPGGAFMSLGSTIFLVSYRKLYRWRILLLFAGMIPPLAVHFTVNYMVFGDLLPSYLHPEAWQVGHWLRQPPENFEEKTWSSTLNYAWHSLLGDRGLFRYSPILVVGLMMLLIEALKPTARHRRQAMAFVFVVVLHISYHILSTTSYGGIGYSTRYYISMIPLLFVFLPRILPLLKRRFIAATLLLILCTSIWLAVKGIFDPWPGKMLMYPKELRIMQLKKDAKFD